MNFFFLTMLLSFGSFYSAMAIFGTFNENPAEIISGNAVRFIPIGIALMMYAIGWAFVGYEEDLPEWAKRMQILSTGEYLKILAACFVGAGGVSMLLHLDYVNIGTTVWTFTIIFVLEFFAIWGIFTYLQGPPREISVSV